MAFRGFKLHIRAFSYVGLHIIISKTIVLVSLFIFIQGSDGGGCFGTGKSGLVFLEWLQRARSRHTKNPSTPDGPDPSAFAKANP
jgi:hypothetical protein